ncbi:MAG: efflux RND transporter periplasmic adaptor subunit [Ignavibacteriaceae bacterium]|nr:efflux RND transporter periplasmic adaptor subunit [Ignavibacteriaceae bacterium]
MQVKSADLNSLRIKRDSGSGNNSKARYIIIALIIVLLAIIAIWMLTGSGADKLDAKVITVYSSSSSGGEEEAVLAASGYVVAQRKASVASKGTGRLVFLGVVEGDQVYKGQIIARIEDEDIKAQLAQAKANLSLSEAELTDAENSYNRSRELLKTGSGTQVEHDAADARLKRVKASIEVAKAIVLASEVSLENTLIRAPFNGTVLTKNADVGEVVAPFAASASSRAAVVTIADMTSLQVEADVSESNIQKIKPNQDCTIALDAYPNIKYPGYVAKIVPTADRAKATVLVKIGFKEYDSKVLPEMSAKVQFLSQASTRSLREEKTAIFVPVSAIITENGNSFVYKVVSGKTMKQKVTLGERTGTSFEIVSGISDGDRILESPDSSVTEGMEIKD